jgi:hypothetical protein
MRVPDVIVVRSRTVVVPPTTVGYNLDGNGERSDEDRQSRALERTVGAEFDRQARAKGALPLPLDKVKACGQDCASLLSTAMRWGTKAAVEIAVAEHGGNHSGRSSVGQWQSGRDFRPLGRAMDADFALVFYAREVHETAGRQFVENSVQRQVERAARNEDDFKRMGVVCALELASGRMVWCSALSERGIGKYVDIASPKEARQLVAELLAEF